ncbi:PREDICTED: aluminum-activated malate transporter 9-like [Fragaria vesca subsp. vesca]|uniref:aluminum-activated malate transporter 9-like n=1 Tax=Fragaria vesca subsp. vesca TaxID=101020 RepID=UPI0002C3768C|nr:PREDICTED: aluminum-activated malate transporter 9-like [Fragaria vesca subsp. vesca]
MNGKKGSMEISIPCATTKVMKQHDIEANGDQKSGKKGGGGESFSFRAWMWRVWEFTKEDSNRVKFAFKVGLAVLLVSLLILFRAPYEVFGTNIIWSILTVAIMFEYTVGATFNRGFNRALGSLLAGVLAISVAQVALRSGRVAEPIIIGISIFIVGAVTSFMKLWPSLVPYEYGFRVILFTYCLIVVSGYRMSMGNPMRTAMDRLYSIAIGGFVAVFVNVLVFPIWAGELLHKELVNNFNSVADSLEECVRKYLADDGTEHPEFSKTVMDEFPDEPAYRKCRSTLNSSAKLESLAVSAKWEPPHGRFRHFFYPWSEYVKVAAVLRYCAYEVMALHGVLHSEIQAPYNLRITFQSEIKEASSQAAELVRSLGQDISNMKRTTMTSLLKRVHSSTEKLQRAIDIHSYLLTSSFDPPDSNNISKPLPKLTQTLSSTFSDLQNQLQAVQLDRTTSLEKNQSTQQQTAEPYHELMRKQSRRLHYSWPPRQVDAFEDDGSAGSDFLPRMKAFESTAALSLATFTSLLIEFVARLDHLVEAVDELSKMAKF